jgi:hypothetical protein
VSLRKRTTRVRWEREVWGAMGVDPLWDIVLVFGGTLLAPLSMRLQLMGFFGAMALLLGRLIFGAFAAATSRRSEAARVPCEHVFVTYLDALLIVFELADKGDRRYQAVAARWHAKFVLAANLSLGESEMLVKMLAGIRGANRLVLRRRLLERVEREGLSRKEMPARTP